VYENVHQPVISRREFARRLVRHGAGAILLLVGSLAAGIAGYMFFGHLHFVDAFLNASMILGGMGPVDVLKETSAKIFAGIYALYSGVVFLIAVGVIAAPILHRIMHKLHVDPDATDSNGS